MASLRAPMTRELSTDSSALSNIDVAGTMAEDSGSEWPSASTPPTSISDSRSLQSTKAGEDIQQPSEEANARRTKRVRARVGSYNLKRLSDAQLPTASSTTLRKASALSGRTLVNDANDEPEETTPIKKQSGETENQDWDVPADTLNAELPPRPQRKPSIKDRVKNAAGTVRSVLGKRGRDMVETGKRRLGIQKEAESLQHSKLLKELDMGKRGVLDELDLDQDFGLPLPPPKRVKKNPGTFRQPLAQPVTITGPLQKTSDGKKVKKWLSQGLFVGQDADLDPARVGPKKLVKKRPGSSTTGIAEGNDGVLKAKTFMPLPMFSYLDKTRDFRIPYDVFAPSFRKGDEKPKDWRQLNRNRLVGEGKEVWDDKFRVYPKDKYICVCKQPSLGELGCGDSCLNRAMEYECDDRNCPLDASDCSNRAFQKLGERIKKGGAYDVGVEVIKTENRGFGIRACRSFEPNQIIMEYTGEIISEGECQRRMREEYSDKKCYYLMEMSDGLVIDGTKGSMARFINHSCEPNCVVRMVQVNGTPRMGIFAGKSGIMTGEELTYDYNFDNFGDNQQKCYCGAENCRGALSKRLNAAEMKKLAKEESERKRKAEEELARQEEANRRKKARTSRDEETTQASNWRGWVSLHDPEVVAKLKEEKKLKEASEQNTSRAKRMAARRRGSLPTGTDKPDVRRKASPRRRRTFASGEGIVKKATESKQPAVKPAQEDEGDTVIVKSPQRSLLAPSTLSRFHEDLDGNVDERPASSSHPGSRLGARGAALKRSTFTFKTATDTQDAATAEDGDGHEDSDDAAVGVALAAKKKSSLRKKPATAADNTNNTTTTTSDSPDLDADPALATARPKLNSFLTGFSNAVKNVAGAGSAAAAAAAGGRKWKQSTLSFGK